MSTFIKRYGHVIYKVGKFKAYAPCEIPGCEDARVREQLHRTILTLKWHRPGKQIDYVFKLPTYYVDHCHKHGYVRGILCGTCNNLMREYDRYGCALSFLTFDFIQGDMTEMYEWYILDLPRRFALKDYAMNCPACRSEAETTADHLTLAVAGSLGAPVAVAVGEVAAVG